MIPRIGNLEYRQAVAVAWSAWLIAALSLSLLLTDARAHDPKRRSRKPTKATQTLKKGRAQMDAAKAKLSRSGKYDCCVKPSCDMCARTNGACECAANVASGKGACGECLEGWQAGLGIVKKVEAKSIKLLPASERRVEDELLKLEEIALARDAMTAAKRTLVSEGRYTCCIRGGCDSCAHGGDCPCGAELARVPSSGTTSGKEKGDNEGGGVCGECLDSWHAGHGAFQGIEMEEVKLATTGHASGLGMMSSQGSGTSLQPETTPISGWRLLSGDWMIMMHANIFAGFNRQATPRGVGKAESQNWLMVMADRNLGPGRLSLRGMFSAEPLTTPHGGSPLLFQTGETYRGYPIIDAQHPHDLFMELAATYTLPISEFVSVQFYGGPVGEPALGPVAYMHRASAAENPSAPLGHHWQDSAHIAHGVITGAISLGRFKIEASGFRGREPDEDRVGLDLGKLDSYSFRGWFNPTPNWAMQFSYGFLKDPEQIHPGNLIRHSASISYNRPLGRGNWASSLIWGRNSEVHGVSNAYLFESTFNFSKKNHVYTRLELVDKQGMLADNIFSRPGICPPEEPFLFVLPFSSDKDALGGRVLHPGHPGPETCPTFDQLNRWFRIGAFTFGGVRDLFHHSRVRIGLGSDVTFYHQPSELYSIYGTSPVSYRVFLRVRLGDM
jgi:hypothetical protein